MDAAEKARSRQAALIEAGLSDEEATKLRLRLLQVLVMSNLKYWFKLLQIILINGRRKRTTKTRMMRQMPLLSKYLLKQLTKKLKLEAKVDEEVLETVKAEEASSLSVASDAAVGSDDGIDVVRAGLQDWVSTVIINTKNSNSGE